ncbi:hypothetical protein EOC06_38170 [Mesorhizobium sp. M7A.F.Ca.MR.362.00.0.0]|nr:hypothetical protein EOC06_38170 [Mesorhizobium sp. M7A.F.Ca.MR.362.00.0.0]
MMNKIVRYKEIGGDAIFSIFGDEVLASEKFADADSFYNSIDQKQYHEYKNAKMNIREKVSFKDINKVLSKADKFIGENRVSGNGYDPNRQVYVYLTVSENGKDIKNIVVDAETKQIIIKSEPLLKP